MTDFVSLFPDEKRREIIRKVVATPDKGAEDHGTYYCILDKGGNALVDRPAQACYAGLPVDFHKVRKDARYSWSSQTPQKMGEKTAIRWLQLCKKNGALGNVMQSAEEIFHRGLKIDVFDPHWSIDRIDIAFCNYRFLREGQTMVRNIIKLVDEAHVPFWNAFAFCHGHSFNNTSHTWLGWSAYRYSYGSQTAIKHKNNIRLIRFLMDYLGRKKIKSKTRHFDQTAIESPSNYTKVSWSTANHMVTDGVLEVKDRVEMLTDKAVAAVNAPTFEEAKKIYE